MSGLLLLTNALEPSDEVLPALGLLLHSVRVAPAEASALIDAPPADVVLVDARRDLVQAKSLCRLLRTTGLDCPLLAIVTEGGLAALNPEWGVDDVLLQTAGPAEVEARLRLAVGRASAGEAEEIPGEIRSGDLTIDEATYTARLRVAGFWRARTFRSRSRTCSPTSSPPTSTAPRPRASPRIGISSSCGPR